MLRHALSNAIEWNIEKQRGENIFSKMFSSYFFVYYSRIQYPKLLEKGFKGRNLFAEKVSPLNHNLISEYNIIIFCIRSRRAKKSIPTTIF